MSCGHKITKRGIIQADFTKTSILNHLKLIDKRVRGYVAFILLCYAKITKSHTRLSNKSRKNVISI